MVAFDAQRQCLTVKASRLIEDHATEKQRTDGYDIADYFINQQKEINQFNEQLPRDMETIFDEQKSLLVINGGLSERDAEAIVTQPDNMRDVALSLKK